MTKDEKDTAIKMLDVIIPAIPEDTKCILPRVMAHALRELIERSHGAASHAPKVTRVRKARTVPMTLGVVTQQ